MQQQPPVLIRGPADLRPGDILLGRGNKHSRWPGNIHFRSLVQERQGEYVSIRGDQGTKSVSNWTKNGIASEIFEAVRAGRTSSLPPSNSAFAGTRSAAVVAELANGRFLRQADAQTPAQAGLPSGAKTADDNGRPRGEYWQEVTTDVALEKIKMSLRQQKKGGKNDADADSCGSDDDSSSSSDDGKKKRKRKAKTKTRKKKNRTARSSSSAAEEDGDHRKPAAIPAGIPLQVSIGGACNTGMMGMSPLPGLSVLPGAPTGTNISGGSSGTNNNGLLLNLLLQQQQQQQRATQQTGLLNLLAQQQSWNSGSAPNNNNNNVAVLAALLQQQQQQAEQALLQQLLRQQQPPSNANNSNNAAQAFLLQQILQQGQVQGQQQVQLPQLQPQPQPALAVGSSPNLAALLPLLQRQQGANNYINAVSFPTATQGTDVTGTNAPQATQQPGLALLAALAGAGTGGSGAPAEASGNDGDDGDEPKLADV